MNIDFSRINAANTAISGNFGQIESANDAAAGVSPKSANLSIGNNDFSIASSEPAGAVPESALDRNDDIGRIMSQVFNLPAPPMPAFT
ncbi:MAG: hypothetical protein J6P13_07850 [Kiritimatiellae bacterium]|nr:hypothetical protein [Kiritimatiellia bacterium]